MKPLAVLSLCWLSLPALAASPESASVDAVPAMLKVDYQCAAHRLVSVEYPPPEQADALPIRIVWHGRHYRLLPASSASGARYVSQQLVWWSKGEQAMLLTRGGRTLARDCQVLPAAGTPSP